ARGRDHSGASSRGELDEQATRDSAGSVDDDPAAALDPERLVECLSRSERRNGKRSAGFPCRLWRPDRDGRRRRKHPPRPRPVTPERQRMCDHLVALAQLGHTGAGGYDRPGRLRPERHRSRAADLPAADPDQLVPVADSGSRDVEQDLVWGRRRQLVHIEDLDGLASCRDPGHSHPVQRSAVPTSSTTLPRFPRAATRSNAASASVSGKAESTSARSSPASTSAVNSVSCSWSGSTMKYISPGISSAMVTTRSPTATSPPRVS